MIAIEPLQDVLIRPAAAQPKRLCGQLTQLKRRHLDTIFIYSPQSDQKDVIKVQVCPAVRKIDPFHSQNVCS
jgi:hypothetical protein